MLTAVILRFLRSKLFLTAIFFASLTYFLVSFYSDGSALLTSNEDVHELGSGRRPLGHVFQWQGPEDNNLTKTKPSFCRNSVQGRALIADDKGQLRNVWKTFFLGNKCVICLVRRLCLQSTKCTAKWLLQAWYRGNQTLFLWNVPQQWLLLNLWVLHFLLPPTWEERSTAGCPRQSCGQSEPPAHFSVGSFWTVSDQVPDFISKCSAWKFIPKPSSQTLLWWITASFRNRRNAGSCLI